MTRSSGLAVTVRTALIGGLLSVVLSLVLLSWQSRGEGRNVDSALYFIVWSLVGLATMSAFLFLSRRLPTLKRAIPAMTPPLLSGAALSACLTLTTGLPLLPTVFWLVFYGLTLLSVTHFAPQPVIALGWAFLFTGIGAFFYLMYESIMPEFDLPTPTRFYPAALMGLTFGGYHLIYAAWMWLRRRAR